ncbi:MAG: hypothetical protein ACE5G9_05340 [Nitrospinales bacterium]
MIRPLTIFLSLVLLPAAVSAGQVKVYLDNSRTRYIMMDKQDCSVHKNKDGYISFGFKAGLLFFGVGPEVSFGKKSGIDWNQTTQNLIARYQELCSRFNTGSLTKSEYDRRLEEIEMMDKKVYELRMAIRREKARHRQDLFDELDRETNRLESLRNSFDEINKKLGTSPFKK